MILMVIGRTMGALMATGPGDCLATVSARAAGRAGKRENEWVELAIGSCVGFSTPRAGKREI